MVPASELPERAAPPTVSTGIVSVDALAGGVPCGALTEICGPPSSGRSSLLIATLAAMTQEGKACALVDVTDSFDPLSASTAGVDLRELLWVRCNGVLTKREPLKVTRYVENDFGVHEAVEVRTDAPISAARAARKLAFRKLEQGLRAADLLLQGGGFSLIALDAVDLAPEISRRVPMTTWFRFRRAVENTPTAFVLLTRTAVATGCASLSLHMERTATRKTAQQGKPTHARLLKGMEISVEMLRDGGQKKRARSVPNCQFSVASGEVRRA
jgi:recA bacterial DNA recombination protein